MSQMLCMCVCVYVTMCKMSVVRKDEMRTGRIFPNFETLALFKHRGLIFKAKVERPRFWCCHCPK